MKKIIFTIVSVIGLLLPHLAHAQGTLYLSNLNQPTTGSAGIASDEWLAESFQTGNNPGGYVLNSIELSMNIASGNPSGFTVSLYGNGGFPGNNLGNLTGPTNPLETGLFSYVTSGIMLSADTIYFIVLTSETPTEQGLFMQTYAAGYDYSSSDNWILGEYRYNSADGINWNRGGYSGEGLQFAIYATSVPEPAAWSLILLGGGVFLYVRTRKQRAA